MNDIVHILSRQTKGEQVTFFFNLDFSLILKTAELTFYVKTFFKYTYPNTNLKECIWLNE